MPEITMKIGDDKQAPMVESPNIETKPTPEGGVTVSQKPSETPTTETKTERPAWLPEKFNSPEDMAKSYVELEKKLGSQTTQAPAAAMPKGIDLGSITKEYAETNGKLSDATLKDLESKGVTKAVLDTYINGQQAIAREQHNTLAETVGGTENFGKILSWAKTGLSAGETKAYNDAIDSGNIEGAKLLLGSISQKYAQANGVDPKLIVGNRSPRTANGPKPFASTAEVVKAMKDPRYQTDAAYQRQVMERLDGTDFFTTGAH